MADKEPERRGLPGYVEQCLVPILKSRDIVVVDNVSFHKVFVSRQAIQRRRTQDWLPAALSPEFNPIELVFTGEGIVAQSCGAHNRAWSDGVPRSFERSTSNAIGLFQA